MIRAYEEDLAYIHDAGFGDFAREAAPGLLRMMRRAGIRSGLVVDLGCGSGIWARELVDAGFDVLGVDISSAMLALSRKLVPEGKFFRASLHHVELPRCVCVTSLGECLGYSFGESRVRNLLRRTFDRVFSALEPGGLFIFDMAEPARARQASRKYTLGTDWAVLFEAQTRRGGDVLERRITAFRKTGKLYRRSEEVHRVRLYPRSVIAGELREAGFRVRTLSGYGSNRFPRGIAGFLARKPV